MPADAGHRSLDLTLTKGVLYQLSYTCTMPALNFQLSIYAHTFGVTVQ